MAWDLNGEYYTLNFTVPKGELTVPVIFGAEPVIFNNHSPRADVLNAAKVCADNFKDVAADLLSKVDLERDDFEVDYHNSTVIINGVTFNVGDFIVREWDYTTAQHVYRVASFDERVKYDLR